MGHTNIGLCAPLQQLKDEHVSLRKAMNQFYDIAEEIEYESGSNAVQLFNKLHELILNFTEKLKAHSKKEDEVLFPMVRRRLGVNDRTIEGMEFEHEKAEQHLQDFLTEAAQTEGEINDDKAQWITVYGVQAYTTLIQHFATEEKVLFPMAENVLSIDEKDELGRLIQGFPCRHN
jgi:regulator of cell morphogenesis and NO signaling